MNQEVVVSLQVLIDMPTGHYKRGEHRYDKTHIRMGMMGLEYLNAVILCKCGCGELTRKFNNIGTRKHFVDAGHSNRNREHTYSSWAKGKTKFNDSRLMKISKKMKGNRNGIGNKGKPPSEEQKRALRNYVNIRTGMIRLEADYHKLCDCGCGEKMKTWNDKGQRTKCIKGHMTKEHLLAIKISNQKKIGSPVMIAMGKRFSIERKGIPMPKYQRAMIIQKNHEKNIKQIVENQDRINEVINDDIIIGLLLSDADLRRPKSATSNSQFHLTQKTDHIDFIYEAQDHLKHLGFTSIVNSNKVKKNCLLSNGNIVVHGAKHDDIIEKVYYQSALTTRNSVVWSELRNHWYKDNFKFVPRTIKLNPKILAWWYMGDGSSTWTLDKKSVSCTLSTQGFSKEDTLFLQQQLSNLSISTRIRYVKVKDSTNHNTGWIINFSGQENVRNFMMMIRPFIIPIFMYKIKIPRVRNKQIRHAEYMNNVRLHPLNDKQRIIAEYIKYQSTNLTRVEIYDIIMESFNVKRKQVSQWCRYYINQNKKEYNRKTLPQMIIEFYLDKKKQNIENIIIYDMIQKQFNIPDNKRKSMIRNPISLLNTGKRK